MSILGHQTIKLFGLIRRIWKLWCLSLGEKASDNSKEADIIALFRTVIVLLNAVTCLFIISGIIRHWG